MTAPLLTGIEVVSDAADIVLDREARRIAAIETGDKNAMPTDEQRAEAIRNLKRRLIAILEWRP